LDVNFVFGPVDILQNQQRVVEVALRDIDRKNARAVRTQSCNNLLRHTNKTTHLLNVVGQYSFVIFDELSEKQQFFVATMAREHLDYRLLVFAGEKLLVVLDESLETALCFLQLAGSSFACSNSDQHTEKAG